MIENIYDYLSNYGNCFKQFIHDEKRTIILKWHGEVKHFTASWIENKTILTAVFTEAEVYRMINNGQLIEIK